MSLSSTIHDIDLAVETGRGEAELSPRDEKQAELGNLEFVMSQIKENVCEASDNGGTLRQLKDFNAFLERAAVALESR